jgi:hypothetical protein
MNASLIRERPQKPAPPRRDSTPETARSTILTRAELAECTCPEHCERDHGDE